MELWQVGAVIRSAERIQPDEETTEDGKVVSTKRRNLTAERIAYKEGRGPKPEPDEPKPSASMAQLMSKVQKG